MENNNVTISENLESLFQYDLPLYETIACESDPVSAYLTLDEHGNIDADTYAEGPYSVDVRHGLTLVWEICPNITGDGLKKFVNDCLPELSKLQDERSFDYSFGNGWTGTLSEDGEDLDNEVEDLCRSSREYETLEVWEWDEYYSYDTSAILESLRNADGELQFTDDDVRKLAKIEVAEARLGGYALEEYDFPAFVESAVEEYKMRIAE